MHSIWVTIIGCTFIFAGGYTSLMKAPVGNIKSLSISDCESTTKQITNLYNINESGEKALDATIALPDDFDGTKTKSAPVGKIKSLSLSDCGPNQKTSLYNINEEGEKAVDASLELKEDLDGTKARSAPVGNLKSLSMSDCEPGKKQKSTLYNINEKGVKAFDISLELDEDFDAKNAKFSLDVAKWDRNTWREDIYNIDGNLCEYIKNYVPKIWTKLQAVLKPPFTGDDKCFAKKGIYELKKFQASSADINIPTMWYGKFKLTFKYGDVGELELLEIKKCDVDNPEAGDLIDSNIEYVNGANVLNAKISLKTVFDESFTYKAVIIGDDGVKFEFKGVLCEDVFIFIPNLWDKLSSIVGINKECPIQPGEYEINNFGVSPEGIGLPFVFYGHLNIQVSVYKDEKPVACTEFIINSKEIQ
ncbi:unnamed protein product [Brassicogethes aeneus]|uniref:MD-2-related lipid-recognition domain-containing protein n=1 Tax=Brassicogethes aeneus TaxID=1431903 RepID=A0A9P0F8H7_BRAAE|nr:unnamed protein product [Brassicogethes aeneus]